MLTFREHVTNGYEWRARSTKYVSICFDSMRSMSTIDHLLISATARIDTIISIQKAPRKIRSLLT